MLSLCCEDRLCVPLFHFNWTLIGIFEVIVTLAPLHKRNVSHIYVKVPIFAKGIILNPVFFQKPYIPYKDGMSTSGLSPKIYSKSTAMGDTPPTPTKSDLAGSPGAT